ncbi:TPA: hypothetical protein ACNH4I_003417 [Serratia marcescens]|uniref:hypothetical protein n=1 Tax=Enterobacterales TaxID=91347 RepID=UPI000D90B184|nr:MULTISPECIES: hypothetical protein [Enterobacterales]PYZ20461.1 hypothetical protein DNK77_28830 [Enterobacter cloacae complex sp.]RAY67519.1 hypothetical protein DP199_20225 [Enterobacter kobei]HEC5277340.1 hypothetical protein [Enterobacter cloacae]MBE0080358.1 hypothetical protein [Citrobacter koseri]MDX7542860.1 hypothetical protein [Serratia marcescens]
MYKKLPWLLLILPAFSAMSEPVITCEPESVFRTYLFPFLGYCVLLIVFVSITAFLFDDASTFRTGKKPWLFVIAVNSVVTVLGILLTSYTLHLVPEKKAVVNEAVLMSAPDVNKGLHYQNDCIMVSRNDTAVTLNCRPDSRTEIVPLADYARATSALEDATAYLWKLKSKVSRNNICRPDKTSFFDDLFSR